MELTRRQPRSARSARPGRLARLLERLRAGTAHRIVKPGQVFSRIHVADIAEVLQAALARPDAGPIYNVADDEPSSSTPIAPPTTRAICAMQPSGAVSRSSAEHHPTGSARAARWRSAVVLPDPAGATISVRRNRQS